MGTRTGTLPDEQAAPALWWGVAGVVRRVEPIRDPLALEWETITPQSIRRPESERHYWSHDHDLHGPSIGF